jgi:glycine C-acetyltransferase
MLRIIPTAAHTLDDVDYTIKCFKEVKEKLEAGKYKSDKIGSLMDALQD